MSFESAWHFGTRLVGSFLILAAIAKALSPESIRPIFAALDVPWTPWYSVVLVAVEGGLGCAVMLLPGWRQLRRVVIALLIAFTGVLGVLGTFTDPPSCGCLGKIRLFQSARSELIFGIGRNLLFMSILIGPAMPLRARDLTK